MLCPEQVFAQQVDERFWGFLKLYSSNVAQGECERGTEWKIEWGRKGHSFELPNKALGKSVKDEFWFVVDFYHLHCGQVGPLEA